MGMGFVSKFCAIAAGVQLIVRPKRSAKELFICPPPSKLRATYSIRYKHELVPRNVLKINYNDASAFIPIFNHYDYA